MLSPQDLEAKRRELEERRRLRREMRRKRLLFYAFCVLLGLILMLIAAYWSYYGELPFGIGRGRAESPIVNVLLLGVDSGVGQGNRSDTIILFSFDKRDGHVSALAIPRDTQVRIPGRRGVDRINAAHAIGGPALAVRTVEQLLGVDIDYYVRVDFDGFRAIVDALGGVVLDVERRMYYEDKAQGLKIDLQQGLQRLNGDQALQYVRYRSDGMGDISLVDPVKGEYAGRVERQLKFVRALARQAISIQAVLNAPELVTQLLRTVSTDMPPDVAVRLALLGKQMAVQDVETAVLPGTGATVGGASYWLVNEAKMKEVVNKLVLRRSDMVRVQVLNGSGIDGQAARAADVLRREGFEVVTVGNADRFDYETTVVIPRPGRTAEAERVAGVLGGRVQGPEPAAGGQSGADVTVIIGRDAPGRRL